MTSIVLSGIIIGIANALQVITGFGNVVIALPFVALLLGLKKAVMVVTLVAYMLAIYLLITSYKYINFKKILPILGLMLLTLPIGIFIFRYVDPSIFKQILAIFIISISVFSLYKMVIKKEERKTFINKKDKIFSYVLVAISGVFQGAISCGGPLVVLYATKTIEDKKEFRASLSFVWFVLNSIIVSTYFIYGINLETLKFSLTQVPFLIIGIIIGELVHNKLNSRTFSLIVFVLLIVTGIFMLIL